ADIHAFSVESVYSRFERRRKFRPNIVFCSFGSKAELRCCPIEVSVESNPASGHRWIKVVGRKVLAYLGISASFWELLPKLKYMIVFQKKDFDQPSRTVL